MPLELGETVIAPVFSVDGFILEPVNWNNRCESLKEFGPQLYWLSQKQLNKTDEIKELRQKCSGHFPKMFEAMLDLSDKHKKNKSELKDFLSQRGLPVEDVLLRFDQKRLLQKEFVFENFLVAMRELPKEMSAHDYVKSAKLLGPLENSPEMFWGLWTEIALALRAKNDAWVRNKIKSLLLRGPLQLIFETPSLYNELFRQQVIELVLQLGRSLADKKLLTLLIWYLGEFFDEAELKPVISEFGIKSSLSEIRLLSRMELYGKEYLWPWFLILFSRAGNIEVMDSLKKVSSPERWSQKAGFPRELLLYYFPTDENERQIVFKQLQQLARSSRPYDQYVILTLLENKTIKDGLQKIDKRFGRAPFQLKREFFRKTLARGIAIEFCIYNLALLGDREVDSLWWLVL